MPNRYMSDGYNDLRDSNTRGFRDPRDVSSPRDMRNSGDTRGSKEQLPIRDPRERRYPRERRNYADTGEPEERAEVRVPGAKREPRDTRDPRYVMEPTDIFDDPETEHIHSRDRIYVQRSRDTREAAQSRDALHPYEQLRDTRETRYLQDTRRLRGELDDPRILSRRRGDADEGEVQDEQRYRRIDQPSIRDDVVDQGPQRFHYPRDPAPSIVDSRMTSYFLPQEGINFEVIRANIVRYLGPDATLRPRVNREARTTQIHSLPRLGLTKV